MRIILTRLALADLRGIRDYIAQFNPAAAKELATGLVAAADSVANFPERGRPIARGRRELLAVWPYVIRYRIARDTVVILRVRHGRQRPE